MEYNKKNKNTNNFNGQMNFKESVNIVNGDYINYSFSNVEKQNQATYTPEPIWRSPITLSLLTWISFILGIASLFPISELIGNILALFNGKVQEVMSSHVTKMYIIILALLVLMFVCLKLLNIAKNELRIPFVLNYAINGYGKRITLEKVDICSCPICAGKMKYYNKPIEWKDIMYSNGKSKRIVAKRVPVLECKRNNKHCYEVDPAEVRL